MCKNTFVFGVGASRTAKSGDGLSAWEEYVEMLVGHLKFRTGIEERHKKRDEKRD